LFPGKSNVSSDRIIEHLEAAKVEFSQAGRKAIRRALNQLQRTTIDDPNELIRYHEALLFLRAYPQGSQLLKLTETQLRSFAGRVARLRELDVDLSALGHPEVSGIAGTAVSDTFSYQIVRWLVVRLQQGRVDLDEDWTEDEGRLAATLPRFIALLAEDALVEANVPYRRWLCAAKGSRQSELQWLIERFESLPKSDKEKAELYDSLKLYVRWRPPYRASRTGLKTPVRSIYYHQEPLIKRKDISLAEELNRPPLTVTKLSSSEGRKIMDLTRAASTVRYRELYGFTHGDEVRVLHCRVGRGVELFINGVPAEKRLPLRAYHSAMIFKNGVPVGYFEGLSFFERMESGFNLYYTFREGETAWIYAQTLRLFRQLLGVTVFTLDPYQIGFENEEGIESGAFWFYRKLGFRPTRKELLALTLKEEQKLATRAGYRTAASTLRKLAAGYMIYELPPETAGAWDNFQVRRLGMAAQLRSSREFQGDAEKLRAASMDEVIRALNLRWKDLTEVERVVLAELAPVLALITDLKKWSSVEKAQLAKIIRAKAGASESSYLRFMQRHARLRFEMIRIGS
jgi:hypothetical protein